MWKIYERIRKHWLLAATGCLLVLLAACFWYAGTAGAEGGFGSLRLTEEGGQRKVACDETDGVYTMYLPSGFGQSASVTWGRRGTVSWQGKILKAGDIVELGTDTEAELVFYDLLGRETERGTLRIFRGENLPSLFLSMQEEDLLSIQEEKGNLAAAWYALWDEKGVALENGKIDEMRTRGNSTWYVPKKSYQLKLQEAISLDGSGEETGWILLANYMDGTYLRNMLGQELGKAGTIPYTVSGTQVNLYVNGKYEGVYYFCENPKAKDGRKKNAAEVSMELEYPERLEEGEAYLTLQNDQPVLIHSPKNLSAEETEEIRSWWLDVIGQMEMNPEDDSIWEKLDLDSWAGMYIMEEIIQDTDIGGASRYFFLRKEDGAQKLYAGPVWDLDQALGNDWEETEGFWVEQQDLSRNNVCRWYQCLIQNERFREQVQTKYAEEFSPALHRMADDGIAREAARLTDSVQMDLERWGGGRTVRHPEASFPAYVEFLCGYVEKRTAFLDRMWIEEQGAGWQSGEIGSIQNMAEAGEIGSQAVSGEAESEPLSLLGWMLLYKEAILVLLVLGLAAGLVGLDLRRRG